MLEAPPDKRPLCVRMPIKVQTYDIDFAGHVNNQVYVRWLEDLRMEMLRVYYPIDRLMAEKLAPILASTEIHYKRPLLLGDAPEGAIWVSQLGQATINLKAEFTHDGKVCAHAHQRLVLLRLPEHKPVRLPPAFREFFLRDLV